MGQSPLLDSPLEFPYAKNFATRATKIFDPDVRRDVRVERLHDLS